MKKVMVYSERGWDGDIVELLEMPETINLREAYMDYRRWMKEEYHPACREEEKHAYGYRHYPEWLSFPAFLMKRYDAIEPTDVEIFEED